MKICNILALPTLLYKFETWAIREQNNVSGHENYEDNGKLHMARLQNQ